MYSDGIGIMPAIDQISERGFISHKAKTMLLALSGFSVFIFVDTVRMIFYSGSINEYFNILYMPLAAVILTMFFIDGRISGKIAYISLLFICIAFSTLMLNQKDVFQYLIMISSMLIPFLFVGLKLDGDMVEGVFSCFLKVMNPLCILLLLLGIADYLLGAKLQLFLASRVFSDEMAGLVMLERSMGVYRYYSILGHPLVNAQYFLIFFSMNTIFNKYFTPKLNKYIITVVTLLGLAVSGSKTAMVLGLVLALFCSEIKKHKWVYVLSLIILLTTLYFSPLFQQNLLQRYISGINSGDISTGRNKAITELINSSAPRPGLVVGGGAGYSRDVAWSLGGIIKSFEYPFLMLAYDCSVAGTAIIYLIIFFIPMGYLIKKRQYQTAMIFLILFAYINSNNALANYSDYMAQLCFLIMIIVNIPFEKKKVQKEL